MEKKKFRFILLTALFLIINISIVYAQGTLEPMFQGLQNMGLIGSIARYPFIWDAILFISIFIGLGRSVLGPRFNNPAAGGMIGFALSVIMISGEIALDFSITRDFGPWFLIAGVAFLTFFLLKLMISDSENRAGPMGLIIFIFLTMILNGFPQSGEFISQKSPILFSLLMLFQFIGLVFGFIWLFKMVSNLGGASAGGAMNAAADAIKNTAGGFRNMRDEWNNAKGNPDQNEIANLTREIDQLPIKVNAFRTLTSQLDQIHNTIINNINHDPNYQIPLDTKNNIDIKMDNLSSQISSLQKDYLDIQRNSQFVNLNLTEHNKFNNIRNNLIKSNGHLQDATDVLIGLAGLTA
jgi:hypothetical protein